MPDLPAPVASQIKTPDAMQSLGSVMNFANTAQGLQRGGVALQQEQQDLQQRNALNDFVKTLGQYKKEDGSPDYDRLIPEANRRFPKLAGEFITKLAQQHKEGTEAERALNTLNEERRGAVARVVNAVAELPFEKQKAALENLAEGNTGLRPFTDRTIKVLQHVAQNDPTKLKESALRIGQMVSTIPEQTSARTGLPVGTGGKIVQASPVAQALNGPQDPATLATMTVPPSQREEVTINPVTNTPMVTKKDETGAVTGVSTPPTGGGVPVLQPGEPQEIPKRTEQRIAVNQAAAEVPAQHFNNKKIIELAPQAFTGTGGQQLAKVFSTYGINMVPGDHAANMQRLGHFMALQSQANARAMGAGTDAARAISEQATGSTGWTPDAIVSTAKVNDALSTGVDLFNRGMEKAISKNKGNVLALRDFQNKWSQHFDPVAMQLHNAITNGDKKEVETIVNSVGGRNSAGAHELAAKWKRIKALSETGDL